MGMRKAKERILGKGTRMITARINSVNQEKGVPGYGPSIGYLMERAFRLDEDMLVFVARGSHGQRP